MMIASERHILILILLACVLTTGCSSDDESVEEGSVAISFAAVSVEADDSGVQTRTGDSRELLSMRNTGFSVFASHNAATTLDFMYCQEVAYTQPHYPDVSAHWHYTPLKYWPVPVGTLHFHAFAPYAPQTTTDTGQTGVIGVGATTGSSPVPQVSYRTALSAADVANLLYASADVTTPSLTLTFRHALARVGITMKLAAEPAAGTRVLLESISLESKAETPIARTAICTLGPTPTWSGYATEPTRTFTFSNDPASATDYASLLGDVRYVPTLPAKWQPNPGLTTTAVNVITLGDYAAYLYLIPQAELTFTCTTRYRICTPGAETLSDTQTKSFDVTLSGAQALAVGRTINLNLTLTP